MAGSLNQRGSFTATGTSKPGIAANGLFNLSISGTFVATIELQRSFDKGVTWGVVEEYTAPAEETGEASNLIEEAFESDDRRPGAVQYQLECTAFTSGTAVYALTQ